ncbi:MULTISPECIES: alpha/beta fold hydrolase [unclassified Streptomyces]|uniref:alpha/beta fold hydrolase n=1 Tax=unclassified Streptomyces TaxID=2593676 RepID=UPI002E2AAC53|nr:alpha/beta fold hydrolase [Streptomyces sp. NBC_01429]
MTGGTGPVVVLLHGWPFSWVEWRALLPLPAARGFTVIAPDLRGSGGFAGVVTLSTTSTPTWFL